MKPWEIKAHRIVAQYCRESYLRANTPNKTIRRLLRADRTVKLYKRHVPYSVPAIADALVNALGLHNERAREYEIKRLLEVERLGAWSLI